MSCRATEELWCCWQQRQNCSSTRSRNLRLQTCDLPEQLNNFVSCIFQATLNWNEPILICCFRQADQIVDHPLRPIVAVCHWAIAAKIVSPSYALNIVDQQHVASVKHNVVHAAGAARRHKLCPLHVG